MMSEDTSNVIGSQELVVGCLPLNGQDGADPSGLEAVPVSRFRARDSEKAMPTNATSGPLFNALSPSAALSYALGSKLVANLEGSGCPLYRLIWSQQDMPSGPQIFRLRASGRHTSGSDSTGWPTPVSQPANGTPEDFLRRKRESVARGSQMGIVLSDLQMVAKTVEVPLAGWPTPDAIGFATSNPETALKRAGKKTSADRQFTLGDAAHLAGWVTPSARDWKDAPGMATEASNPGRIDVQTYGPVAEAGTWIDVEWLPCADGKARPTQPGLHPLAARVPGDVAKLRALGNAVVPEVAAAFIQAYMATQGGTL